MPMTDSLPSFDRGIWETPEMLFIDRPVVRFLGRAIAGTGAAEDGLDNGL